MDPGAEQIGARFFLCERRKEEPCRPSGAKLEVDGGITGNPTIGGGFPDSCDGSPGATIIGCN